MVILHDEIKIIQNGVLVLFIEKEEKSVSFQNTQTNGFERIGGLGLFKTSFFLNPGYLSTLFL